MSPSNESPKTESALPGPELDTLIHTKVMGKNLSVLTPTNPWSLKPGSVNYLSDQPIVETPPPYSSSIEHAWEVVEKLDLFGLKKCWSLCHNPDHWVISDGRTGPEIFGSTAPHAIALAALAFVESVKK